MRPRAWGLGSPGSQSSPSSQSRPQALVGSRGATTKRGLGRAWDWKHSVAFDLGNGLVYSFHSGELLFSGRGWYECDLAPGSNRCGNIQVSYEGKQVVGEYQSTAEFQYQHVRYPTHKQ